LRKSRKRKPPAKATVPVDNKLLVSREEAAAMLSISVRGVDYYIATKRLSTRRIANRVLIPIEEIRKFARSDHPERMAG
jgi:predicted transcriptional regulator